MQRIHGRGIDVCNILAKSSNYFSTNLIIFKRAEPQPIMMSFNQLAFQNMPSDHHENACTVVCLYSSPGRSTTEGKVD